MEISNENEVSPQEESFTKKEIEDGDVRIPLRNLFPYLFNMVSQSYGQRVGVDTEIGRNFLLLSQYNSRQKMEKLKGYQFLTPLLVDSSINDDTPLPLVCMERFPLPDNKSTIVIHLLNPKYPEGIQPGEPTPNAMTEFFAFFTETIRTRSFEQNGLTFAHIAASILESRRNGYLHFNIQSGDEETPKLGDTRWSFQCHKNELFIYPATYSPPLTEREETFLSPWISSTTPCVKRTVVPFKYYHFTNEELTQMENDEDVKKILASKGEKKE